MINDSHVGSSSDSVVCLPSQHCRTSAYCREPKGKVALLVPPLALNSSYVSRITRYPLELPGKREI